MKRIVPAPLSIRLTVVFCLILLWLGATQPVFAAPVAPMELTFTQPDGTEFTAVPFGDEWNNGYEHDGYTILQDEAGFWVYARVEDNGSGGSGQLSPTTLRVAQDSPGRLPRHARDATRTAPDTQLPSLPQAPTVWPGVSGSQPVLVILVNFTPSTSLGTTAAQWHTAMFSNAAGAKSVKNFYEEASYGEFTIDPASETEGTANDGIISVTLGYSHPNTRGSTGDANRQIVRNALIAADSFINYSSFDSNSNGSLDVTEFHLIVIPRGFETAFGGTSSACAPSVWGHRWSLSGTVTAPTLDGVTVAGSSGGGGYMQFGEWQEVTGAGCTGSTGNMATIGIMAHELGHDIDWPDLYDTDGSSAGVGYWSIMASGSWGYDGSEPAGATPVLPDPFSKWYQNWLTPVQVTTPTTNVAIPNSAQNDVVYQLLSNPNGIDWDFNNGSGTGEYFLIENRQQVGFDAGLNRIDNNAKGCLIWHIDETRTSSNANNDTETRKHVDLEEANGVQNLDTNGNRGDTGDPWPGSSNNTAFANTSTPNSKLYSGSNSGATVTNISTAGTGCTVTFMATPNINLPQSSISGGQIQSSQTSHTLTIENTGSYTLNWSLAEDDFQAAPLAPTAVLYDNGSLINSSGTGSGGANESQAQNSTLGMTTLGFSQNPTNNRIADNFTISGLASWQIDTITLYAYQTGSTTTSTITSVNLRIWNGPPNDPNSTVVFGNTTTNRLASSSWSGIYRVSQTTSGATSRPIMANTVTVGTALAPGTYWLDWQTGGSLTSGPWAPPITINGQSTTGDALQSTNGGSSWISVVDGGTGTQQGMPFLINGTVIDAACVSTTNVDWLAVSATSGAIPASGNAQLNVTLDSAGKVPGVYAGQLCISSDDGDSPLLKVDVTMTVCSQPAAPTLLTIVPNGGDETAVDLTWSNSGATTYELWFAANNPYFTPGTNCAASPSSCTSVSGHSWTHTGALSNPSSNYTYKLLTRATCGSSTLTSPTSNSKAEFEYTLIPGS